MKKQKILYVFEIWEGQYGGGIMITDKKETACPYGMVFVGTMNQFINKTVLPAIKKYGKYENAYIE
jgi:hypothetical protein